MTCNVLENTQRTGFPLNYVIVWRALVGRGHQVGSSCIRNDVAVEAPILEPIKFTPSAIKRAMQPCRTAERSCCALSAITAVLREISASHGSRGRGVRRSMSISRSTFLPEAVYYRQGTGALEEWVRAVGGDSPAARSGLC